MIQLRSINLSFGDQKIFNNVSAVFNEKQRIGIVGRNGVGKSTLLRVIAKQSYLDSGDIVTNPNKKIAYMPQEVVFDSTKTVFDEAFSVFDEYLKIEDECKKIQLSLENNSINASELLENYVDLENQLKNFDKSAAIKRTENILNGLGFTKEKSLGLVKSLSVGWKMRLILAKLLLQDADFYLFDEPTNHLDITAKEWFLEFLKKSNFGFLLVTHDRYFLEKIADFIFELERGNGKLYTGNFSSYIDQKEQQIKLLKDAKTRQEKELSKKQEVIDRFRFKASKAKMVQSMIKQVEKVEIIEIEQPMPVVNFSFPETIRAGNIVLTVKNLAYAFGQNQIFKNLNCEIKRGDKVALIAPNGTGKTTFFNVISGKYPPQKGEYIFGHNVQVSVFEQEQTDILKPDNTVFQEVLDACPNIQENMIRKFLGTFLFSGDDVYKKIKVLSGGERNRVAMVKVLLQKANFLILDEPTNHLDMYTKDVLLQALQQYDGTILIVSHDIDFIEKLANKILELTPEGLHNYDGNYESFVEQKKYISEAVKNTEVKKDTKSNISQKEVYQNKKELNAIESKISKLEKEIKDITKAFETLVYGTEAYKITEQKFKDKQKQLAVFMSEWEKLI